MAGSNEWQAAHMMQVVLLTLAHGLQANGLVEACCLHNQQNLLREMRIVSWHANGRQYVQVPVCTNTSTHAHVCPRLCA